MRLEPDSVAILDALGEPALILDGSSTIVGLNRKGRSFLGSEAVGLSLEDMVVGRQVPLRAYLARCMGSSEMTTGALDLRAGNGSRRIRCLGSRITLGGQAGVLLRLRPQDENPFAVLTRKVAELNAEVRERRHAEAVLAEAVRERDLLMRELHHRVKNNLHMLSALLQGSEREASNPEAKAALRDAAARLAAVNAVHQLIHAAADLETIEAPPLLDSLAKGVARLSARAVSIEVDAAPIALPLAKAVSIALIVNELLTNAIKHGQPDAGEPRVRIGLVRDGDRTTVVVQDNGPGFTLGDTAKRASGLGLVRGLLRQLGGSLRVESSGGARCLAEFRLVA